MPNPELRDFQMRQVEAYVLSLRAPSGTTPTSRKPPATRPELCQAEIARVELLMSKARASGQAVGSARPNRLLLGFIDNLLSNPSSRR